MSVLACARRGCPNVMCDRYSHKFGYLCDECHAELVVYAAKISSNVDINEIVPVFLLSEPGTFTMEAGTELVEQINEEFSLT